MDGLIAILLIILGIAAAGSKTKKKQARRDGETPSPAEAVVPEKTKIPFSKEEWTAFLRESSDGIEAAAPKGEGRPVQQVTPASAGAKPVQATAIERELRAAPPSPIMRPPAQHREGEHPRVHAAHVQRIAQEEAKLHREREELRELRNVNLKKLRTAVVMSEVLGKPVSLRPRGRL